MSVLLPSPSTPEGLRALDLHLATRSYLCGGAEPTQEDAAAFDAVKGQGAAAVASDDLPHLARWHRNLSSYGAEGRRRMTPAVATLQRVQILFGQEVRGWRESEREKDASL